MRTFLLICLILCSVNAYALTEKDYQNVWCTGKKEVYMTNSTGSVRCDCVSDMDTEQMYAIEIDYAEKWYQGLGQALYYSTVSGFKAGVALILKDPSDRKYVERLKLTVERKNLDVTIWVIKGEHYAD